MAAQEPVTLHLWMSDDRSLCDRRAQPASRMHHMNLTQLEHYAHDQAHAPVCGACMLLVSRLRRQAAALLRLSEGRVWPAKPTQAWRLLYGTRWAAQLDLDTFLARTDIDERTRFAALADAVDQESVRDLLDDLLDRNQLLQAEVRELRALTTERRDPNT